MFSNKTKFKEAIKSKMRLSITGCEDLNLVSSEELEKLRNRFNNNNNASEEIGNYGWNVDSNKNCNKL